MILEHRIRVRLRNYFRFFTDVGFVPTGAWLRRFAALIAVVFATLWLHTDTAFAQGGSGEAPETENQTDGSTVEREQSGQPPALSDLVGTMLREAAEEEQNAVRSLAEEHGFIPGAQQQFQDPRIPEFLIRDELGFDRTTLETIRVDVQSELLTQPSPENPGWTLLLAMLAVFLSVVILDSRFGRISQRLRIDKTVGDSTVKLWQSIVARIVLRGAPLMFAWLLCIAILQGIVGPERWVFALSTMFLVFFVARVILSMLREGRDAAQYYVGDDSARRLWLALSTTVRIVAILIAIRLFLVRIHYRPDVIEFVTFLMRGAFTAMGIWLWRLWRDILVLFPEGGGRFYVVFRTQLNRYLRYVLLLTALLLVAWTAGFKEAAGTALSKGYTLIIAVALFALIFRKWASFVETATAAAPPSARDRVVVAVNGVARTLFAFFWFVSVASIMGFWVAMQPILYAVLIPVGEGGVTLVGIGSGLLAFTVTFGIARALRVVVEHVLQRSNSDEGLAYAVSVLVYYIVILLGALIALVAFGVDLATLTLFAASFGVAVGFALQDIARNFVSGFTLLFGRSVRKNDFVTVAGDMYGRVTDIGARSITIRSPDNHDVIIPAVQVAEAPIVNWSHTDHYVRLHVAVGVSYNANIEAVRELLLETAKGLSFVQRHGRFKPDVWLKGFGDSSVDLDLLVWVDLRRNLRDEVLGKILFDIWAALQRENVEIPFPQRDLHIRSVGGHADLSSLFPASARAIAAEDSAEAAKVKTALGTDDEDANETNAASNTDNKTKRTDKTDSKAKTADKTNPSKATDKNKGTGPP